MATTSNSKYFSSPVATFRAAIHVPVMDAWNHWRNGRHRPTSFANAMIDLLNVVAADGSCMDEAFGHGQMMYDVMCKRAVLDPDRPDASTVRTSFRIPTAVIGAFNEFFSMNHFMSPHIARHYWLNVALVEQSRDARRGQLPRHLALDAQPDFEAAMKRIWTEAGESEPEVAGWLGTPVELNPVLKHINQ